MLSVRIACSLYKNLDNTGKNMSRAGHALSWITKDSLGLAEQWEWKLLKANSNYKDSPIVTLAVFDSIGVFIDIFRALKLF